MSKLDVAFANLYFAAIATGDVNPSRAGAGSGEVINLSVVEPSDNFADPRWSLVIIRNFTSLGRLRW